MAFTHSRFVWFEYITTDIPKAQGFFGELFNWKTQSMPAPTLPGGSYTMLAIGEHTQGGYINPPPGAPTNAHWLPHLITDNAQATVTQITANGGAIKLAPVKMGDMGTYAVVADPLGGVFALWQPAKAEAGDFKGVDGAFCWNELYTEDPERSAAFYKAIGAFTVEAMDMGGMGTYHVLKTDDKSRAGIMKAPMPGMPQSWMPYVQVASTDASIAKAKRLGANIIMAGQDAADVGRLGIFVDPQGAPLGVLQPDPKYLKK